MKWFLSFVLLNGLLIGTVLLTLWAWISLRAEVARRERNGLWRSSGTLRC